MVIVAFFLVLLDAAIELVGQQVDGRVHVLLRRIRVDGAAAHVQGRLGLLSQLLHRQHTVNVDNVIEVPADALEFLFDITPQRWGDLDVVTGDVELHRPPPVGVVRDFRLHLLGHVLYIGFIPARRRSFEAAMPIASRYLATVRRATGMPSAESSSAMRPSLSGASGSSSLTSLRILARMAVDEVPEPSAPSTWLEKK